MSAVSNKQLRDMRLHPNDIRKVTSSNPPFDVAALARWYADKSTLNDLSS
jgi:hypothetical protein